MNRFVLVIAPVRTDPNFDAKMDIIRSLCARDGLGWRTPEREPEHFDLSAMIEAIRNAAVAVVDLSHGRPSCYYELGLIEALGEAPFLLAESGTQIFQYSGQVEVHFYANLNDYRILIETMLKRALN